MLIVGDGEQSRWPHFAYFTFLGFRVSEAVHGTSALSRARLARPDVIVIDASVAEKGAWDTVRILKSYRPLRNPCIIALGDPIFQHRASTAGVDVLVPNATAAPALAEIVAQHCGDTPKSVLEKRASRVLKQG